MTTKKRKLSQKKSRNSQEDIAAKNFLRVSFRPVKKFIYIAWFLDILLVGLLILQADILVLIFNEWLIEFLPDQNNQPVQSVADAPTVFFALLFVFLLRAGVGYIKDVILTKAGMQVMTAIRSRLLDKLAQLGLARRYFGSDGVLASKLTQEPEHLAGYARFETQKMTAVSTPIILAICIGFFSKTAAWILLATAPLVPLFMIIIGVATARKSREQMDALAQLGGRFLDWIRGMNTLSRLQAGTIAKKDIENSSEAYRTKTMSVLRIAFTNSAVLEFLSALSIALVAVYLGFGLMGILPWQGGNQTIDYSTALMILLLVPEFYAPLRRLGAEYHVKGQAEGAAKAMVGILGFKNTQSGKKLLTLNHAAEICLNQVAAFGDDGRLRLAPVNLVFQSGKTTALMGQSGIGKSTVLQIILGFGQYTGEIKINDGERSHRYEELDISYLRQSFGYLSQTPALLPLSIADNLRLVDADVSDAKIQKVLEMVGLWDLVRHLPDGINTKLSERGAGISGGQAQRLAIAQLVLQDAPIWLLDEPTEHLDEHTSCEIYQLIRRLSAAKTVIWVTHDLKRANDFDVCICLDRTGDDLLKNNNQTKSVKA